MFAVIMQYTLVSLTYELSQEKRENLEAILAQHAPQKGILSFLSASVDNDTLQATISSAAFFVVNNYIHAISAHLTQNQKHNLAAIISEK